VGEIMPRLTFEINDILLYPDDTAGEARDAALDSSPGSAIESVVSVLTPRGFIDSSNCPLFERALEEMSEKPGRFSILDLSETHYINSTGISAIIRQFGIYRQRDGLLVLAAVPKAVGLSMHLLGVTSFIPFHKDVAHATALVKQSIKNGVAPTRGDAHSPGNGSMCRCVARRAL
jgi:anti-anti-sigma factor